MIELNGRANNILDLIGNTPTVEITSTSPNPRVRIFAKLEGNNPGGSVKDRISKYMIEAAEKDGTIGKEQILLEPTSGNTGIGIAMIAAVKGYPFVAVMPESASIERRKTMAAFGAQFILTQGPKGTNWAIEVAHRLIKEDGRYLMLDQFNNPANVEAHYETTGPEILAAVPEIDVFVAGMGTGGTLMGVGRYLREKKPGVKIIGLEPYAGSKIQGLRNMADYVPSIYHEDQLDDKYMVQDADAFRVARDLALREGIFAGISSGAALWGAVEVAKKMDHGTIVTVFPDRGDRYMTTPLFDLPINSLLPQIL
ncbi:MAG: cysteine synthase family protein [Chloroflexi bacterium]|nr:cysteine synthase family protein [Chloroflexota bacterium]